MTPPSSFIAFIEFFGKKKYSRAFEVIFLIFTSNGVFTYFFTVLFK